MKSKDAVDGRLVLLQAQRRWEEQQDEFVRRRRDHEMRMIAMEATEAERREEEIRRRIEGLDEQKRKNRSVSHEAINLACSVQGRTKPR